MIAILEWITWGVSALVAFGLVVGTIWSFKHKRPVMKATVYQGIFLSISVVILLFIPTLSKLHLLWIIPVGFFLTLHFAIQKASE